MFKNRALQVTVVKKDTNNAPNPNAVSPATLETINKIAKENVKTAALWIGTAAALNKILNTACIIAIEKLGPIR